MNNFSQEEISAAKSIRESIIKGDTNFSVKGAYMAGEICMWDELRQSLSGVDVLVKALERIEKICLRDAVGIEPMQKHFRDIYELATTTLAQYNAVEPELMISESQVKGMRKDMDMAIQREMQYLIELKKILAIANRLVDTYDPNNIINAPSQSPPTN